MAAIQPANPIYHDPTPPRTRTRRSSSRKSFASPLSRSASYLDSPRAACPKDGDAFSYDPVHLRNWYLPQNIWDKLPAELQSSVAAVQHSGAAVLTGTFLLSNYYVHCLRMGLILRNCFPSGSFKQSLTSTRVCAPRQTQRRPP